MPIAVLVLMYLEKLIPCCPGSKTRLLDKDELSMEAQGTEAAPAPAPEPEPQQKDDEVGGKRQTLKEIKALSFWIQAFVILDKSLAFWSSAHTHT